MLFIWYILLIVSFYGISANYEYLQYNNVFNDFNWLELQLYKEAGYIDKGNYCLLFIGIGIVSLTVIIRNIHKSITDTEKTDENTNKDE